jgi:hypothetical protein
MNIDRLKAAVNNITYDLEHAETNEQGKVAVDAAYLREIIDEIERLQKVPDDHYCNYCRTGG